MTDIELDARVTALEENVNGNPPNGNLFHTINLHLPNKIIIMNGFLEIQMK